jgi:hypothetical protein
MVKITKTKETTRLTNANQDLAELEGDSTNGDSEGANTLACRCSRGEHRGKDVLRERLEELSNNTSEIERRSENDNVPGIKHFY